MLNTQQLNFHPRLQFLCALKADRLYLSRSDLLRIASSCPHLVHLEFLWKNTLNEVTPVDPNDLKALYQFKNLSSLSLELMLVSNDFTPIHFHNFIFNNLNFADLFFEILVTLNGQTPLRNLEFRKCLYCFLNPTYVHSLFTNLKALETFKCPLDLRVECMDPINWFFVRINQILNENTFNVSFRFVLDNSNEDFVFNWRTGGLFELIKIPSIIPLNDYNFLQSIVLKEIFNDYFGERNTRILFDTFDET
nr:unnamed protein product [Meloidogyne enterolobii]